MLRAKSGVFAVKKCGYICTKERLSATILLQKKLIIKKEIFYVNL